MSINYKVQTEPVEITIKLRLPSSVVILFPMCSIERVINTSIEIADFSEHEDAYINADDWRDMKAPIVSIFECIKDAIVRHRYNAPPFFEDRKQAWPVSNVNQY